MAALNASGDHALRHALSGAARCAPLGLPRSGLVQHLLCRAPHKRWSFDRLSNLAAARVGREARSGALFVFFGRRQDALKVLFFDGTGMCQFYKRLDRHRFKVPIAADARVESIAFEEHELDALLDGLEISVSAPRRNKQCKDEPPVH